MSELAELLGRVPVPVSYAVLVTAVLAESVLLIGAFVPTLTLLLTAGALGRGGVLDLPLVVAAAACAVVAGDALGHRTGRLLGDRARTGRIGRRLPAGAWLRAAALMDAYGGQAVFLARFIPVVRTLAPHLAGAARLPYRRIAPYSAVAAVVWAGGEAGAGYVAAASLLRSGPMGGPAVGVALAVAAVLTLTCAKLRRGRAGTRGRRPDGSASDPPVRDVSAADRPAPDRPAPERTAPERPRPVRRP